MTKNQFITEEQNRTLNTLIKEKKYNEHIMLMEKINNEYYSKYGYPTITIKDEFDDVEDNVIMRLIGELDTKEGLGEMIEDYLFKRLIEINHPQF